MLGKCLWKMHSNPDQKQSVDYREVLDAFGKAIECVPERRDSRHPDKDPILEPHYKLVSIVHKLVQRRLIMVFRSSMKQRTSLTYFLSPQRDVDTLMLRHILEKCLMFRTAMIGKDTCSLY